MNRRGLVGQLRSEIEFDDGEDTLAEIVYTINVGSLSSIPTVCLGPSVNYSIRASPLNLLNLQDSSTSANLNKNKRVNAGALYARRGVPGVFHADWVFHARSWLGARLEHQKRAGACRAVWGGGAT